jgi:SAM-dependent methyltransferase
VPPTPPIQVAVTFSAGGSFEGRRRGWLRYESCSLAGRGIPAACFFGHFRRMASPSTATFRGHPSSDMTADPIREFYTRHPYPPPVANLDRARDEWRDANRHRAEFHLLWPGKAYRADLDILIAGCGTWQAAKYALCRPDARVIGVDVSATSIAHTQKLKQQYGLTNLEIRQLPVERVGGLERQFDLIVCTGVLHHLADPDAGLRALRDVLKVDGAMYWMVYAPYGRTGVYILQDYCRGLGIGTSDREIGELVATLESLPPHHPLVTLLGGSRDAGNTDALADALLNPNKSHAYHDLILVLSAEDKRLFDAVDGRRSIADCRTCIRRSSPRASARREALVVRPGRL